jgi:tetratricopeptide (TPR) repeat protein
MPSSSAFIIRPFGTKKGIDFNKVEDELIDPALKALDLSGRTTGDSLKQGNIRTDMFQRLLMADVVIVDISIGNANVYYELGIRHALRNKRTYLIRCSSAVLPPDEVPFDLRTDRYLSYDPSDPGAKLAELIKGLRETINSDDKDSPVFQLLPDLEEQDKSRLQAVPIEFQEAVERAASQREKRHQWGDLKLLQTEARGFQWKVKGHRVVGLSQFRMKAYEAARDTWEAVRDEDPNDKEANTWLGTIYQRLGNLTEANFALQRVLKNRSASSFERAEARSLIGRNLKEQWKADWVDMPPEKRKAASLRSPFLKQSFDEYRKGFIEDLNHFYSGINALAMVRVMTDLATAMPEIWNESFEDDDEAERRLKKLKDEMAKLSNSVSLSLDAAKTRLERANEIDMWFTITLADLACLTSKKPQFVADQYRNALAGARPYEIDAARRQLVIYDQLGVAAENVQATLRGIPAPEINESVSEQPPHVLLFTGHRIDSKTRAKPRFPRSKEAEAAARKAIKEAVEIEVKRVGGPVIAIAGSASGGDILFHEVCIELGIASTLYLAIPRDEYVKESVQEAGADWVNRFDQLRKRLPQREMCKTIELPKWLQTKLDYNIWKRNNLWSLYNAMALGSQYVTLIALWDGATGDGPGGTEDMVTRAEERGANTIILNSKDIFGL